jgi:6-phosphogluconolactonase
LTSLDLRVHDTREQTIAAFCDALVAAQPRSYVLTGGTTAGDAYLLLASDGWRDRLPWGEMTLYFGDERRVPPDSEESCFHLVQTTLLMGVRPRAVERMRGEADDPEAEADRYGALIPEWLDFTMLGMGDDGHCASLFPGEPVLEVRDRLCVPSRAHYPPYERLTLTFPALNRSRLVAFLVIGERKAPALAAIARGEDLPAGRVRPADGRVVWFVDRAAAGELAS